MTGRRWLQLGLVGLGVVVTVLVILNWSEGTGRRPEDDPGVDLPENDGALVARSENLRLRKSDRSGAQSYYVQADTLLDYSDGRAEWQGNVRLLLYSAPEGEEMHQDTTQLTADQLEQRGPDTEPDQIRLQGNVQIELPGGATIETDRVHYGAANERVTTDAGVELEYAGLSFRGQNLRYERPAARLELWGSPPGRGGGRLRVESSSGAGGAVSEIVGSARRLVFEGEGRGLRLDGRPDLELAGAAVAGNVLILDIQAGQLTSLRSEGEGAVVWSRGGREHVLRAPVVVVELADGELSVVRGCRTGSPPGPSCPAPSGPAVASSSGVAGGARPALSFGGGGHLQADRIDLQARAGDTGAVVAEGAVSLDGRSAGLGLDRLTAGALRLQLGEAGIDAVDGQAGVELRTAEGGSDASLAGDRLSMVWEAGDLSRGSWPDGVQARIGGACAVAGRGEYLSEEGVWELQDPPPSSSRCDTANGEPAVRPRLTDDDYTVTADRLALDVGGQLEASGELDLILRGDSLATVATVFGSGARVDASAGTLRATDGRLELEDDVRLWRGPQLVQSDSLVLELGAGEMRARDGVDVVLEREGRTVDLSGERMLVARQPSELRLAGETVLTDRDRRLSGSTMVVGLDESGLEEVEMQGGVTMDDPDGRAEGQALTWDVESGNLTIFGGDGRPATFRSPQGMQNQDAEGLEFGWSNEGLTIRALRNGTVQTLRSRRASDSGAGGPS